MGQMDEEAGTMSKLIDPFWPRRPHFSSPVGAGIAPFGVAVIEILRSGSENLTIKVSIGSDQVPAIRDGTSEV
jgi:hypothetical protein